MSLISPVLDLVIGAILVIGSLSVGYGGFRWMYPPSRFWKGWKRVGAGGIIGIVWSVLLIIVLLPAVNSTNESVSLIMEFSAWSGIGLVFLFGCTAAATRVVHRMVSHQPFASSIPHPSSFPSRFHSNVQKPSQIRPSQKQITEDRTIELPTIENDVMDMLKETKTNTLYSPSKGNHAFPLEETAPRSPDFGDFSGFEDTLVQLQRDLKEFNENVSKKQRKEKKV
ncbi:MAG: hypothetical protein V1776_04620 [Candidatus Diapherotrites archaeon]